MDLAASELGSAAPPLLHYIYPGVVLSYFLAASLFSVCILHNLRYEWLLKTESSGQSWIVGALSIFSLTYLVQLIVLVALKDPGDQWPPAEHSVVGNLSCLLVFAIQLSCLSTSTNLVSYPYQGAWIIASAFETTLGAFLVVQLRSRNLSRYHVAELALTILRCAVLFFLVFWTYFWRCIQAVRRRSDEECQPLLAGAGNGTASGSGYGSTSDTEAASDDEAEYCWERRKREARESMERRLQEGGNWFTYAKGFMILFPYVWPVGNLVLQLRAAAVGLCLLLSNVLHLLIPRQTGIIMDSLAASGKDSSANPWVAVAVFAGLRLAASDSGVELLRQWLWIPVQYYSRDAMTRAAYSHMIHLSADFHDSKSSSDMMLAIQGGHAVSNAIESVLLQAIPMFIDMCVALIYLSVTFGSYEGFITLATGTIFFILAGRLVAESKTAGRQRVNALYQEHYVRQSGLQGWQTVCAFNQISFEDNRHANAVANRWLREQQYLLNWYISIAFQTMVLTSGLLASAFLAVYRIQNGKASAGQFAMLLMYWSQLSSPLQFFARLGKRMSDDFIDAERLLEIMKTKSTVENKKGARALKFVAGHVTFDNVTFSYDGQKGVIKGISIEVPAGETVAFVGATGAGKSTLLKLLNRFYDATSGSIKIDGQDIRDVDLFSLRDRIGIVPQNPILFDDTIMNNVRYGRITASDEEVFDACRAACILEKIVGFTHGYETRVGERGVKLSGGELQRVAIARAILRRPDIVLLDEATSAVDTDTEQQIQLSFKRLCQGRTTFIVAHRLSTIMNADRIVVVEHGEVVEQGNHDKLIAANGRYADLWSKQVFLRPRDKLDIVDLVDDRPAVVDDLASEQTATEIGQRDGTDADSEGFSADEDQAEQKSPALGHHRKEVLLIELFTASTCSDFSFPRQGSTMNPVAPELTTTHASCSADKHETNDGQSMLLYSNIGTDVHTVPEWKGQQPMSRTNSPQDKSTVVKDTAKGTEDSGATTQNSLRNAPKSELDKEKPDGDHTLPESDDCLDGSEY
ncbi:heavy metal tolerance protein [Metarhizium album ARSEF 1941]|uniref:Heavy metal tolerance protein n=1 Tax=Metarhizium album (strain ARSEF 1941) TaxID=1081103 RepID=A0A0B2WYX1_METAS|nr:heavy metal tolerance protein [Metarhizium album ARSEF 1941]KHN98632.1 heavy metal tolerance protein [Metarhizium album ARSEF 1941]